MATIFTVHGTLATGPEHGDQWWQTGGLLDRELRTYVAADDGEINVRPVIWDGANSELSRREAATWLLSKTKDEDERGGRYVLIGHSHGGSVILNTAIEGASPNLFPKLACIITVGTPFIRFRKSPLLFQRVTFLGKATLLTLFVATATLLVSSDYKVPSVDTDHAAISIRSTIEVGAYYISLFFPLFCAYMYLRIYRADQYRRHDHRVINDCRDRLAGRWCCLYDRNDEAIRGLSSVHEIKIRIFPSHFAVSGLLLFAIFLTSAVIAVSIVTPTFGKLTGVVQLLIFSFETTALLSNYHPLPFYRWLATPARMISVLLALALSMTVVAMFAASAISRLLAPLLNLITWNAAKQSVFGADTLGESGSRAVDHPEWMEVGFSHLPQALSKEINEFSDREAAKSIPHLRSAIADLIQLYNVANPNKSVAEYLTWNELVHTSYFAIPRFRKLLYFIIASRKGFKPTQAFLADPDYQVVAGWHKEIQPQSTA